ncbi:MAG: hypothetical protein HF962_06930 [Sulfurovum sp.]|nr:hypothetical protein [Sulfurovum sp.]
MLKTIALLFLILCMPLSAKELRLTDKQANQIAHKIWLNEGSGIKSKLVWWNKGEEFASVGIGHFIWFTADKPMWFWEAFPPMLQFMMDRGAKPPKWLRPNMHCVWNNYKEWQYAKKHNTPKMRELTEFMNRTKGLQARFMLQRLNRSFPKILEYAKARGQDKTVEQNYRRLLYRSNGTIDPQGAYMLIDYINFKGDGINKGERYQGKGWGLYQVLTRMDLKDSNPYRAFAKSGKWVLDRLTRICPPERNLKRFKRGWFNRMDGYLK